MGEVWLAYDLRLRVEVALKALLSRPLSRTDSAELLHREIRAAREVISPNVCRIFDLVEADGLELLSMEFVDGATLRTLLEEQSPLNFHEAQEIAAQFLAGLQAIHGAGLVHRDFKPENVMITRTGRVVVMDLGLAKPATLAPGSVAGTRPYMAPEQLHGRAIDGRADIFAAAVVLAEMVHPAGVRDTPSRENVWALVRDEPPRLPEASWSPVLRHALAQNPDERYASASAFSRALEEVTRRLGLADEKSPYPGLASFTESESKNFFGREAEVEALWRKLTGPARLLALIGASGAGKSSLLRAGLMPARPEGWRIAIITPGNRPFAALVRDLARDFAGDLDAIATLTQIDDPDVACKLLTPWRRRYEGALVIIDQFEELFTLNPPDVQQRFAALVGRLPIEADVHVLLSMRDDFLIRCHQHKDLAPLFSELTPLDTPTGEALRRALVQPAVKYGYRFEDETLVNGILAEVEGERGALPLMAFAVSQLWSKRDRERGLLTRQAYEEIGGVAGALAQHAEATMEKIGAERISIVRELFRNLVTAQGTRAAGDRSELLSVFPEQEREAARRVLDQLVDARLLTSYEVKD
jgi:hypothetical protein